MGSVPVSGGKEVGTGGPRRPERSPLFDLCGQELETSF